MLRNRKGVTIIEIMTVVTMAILMTAIAFPSLKNTRRASSMMSARAQVQSYLSVARAIAIRNGVRSILIREGHTIRILADSANTLVAVVRPIRLDSLSNVLLSTSSGRGADTIVYDNRGMAVNLDGTQKIYLTVADGQYGAGMKDSICVTRLGLVLDRNCGLAAMPEKKEEEGPISLPPPPIETY